MASTMSLAADVATAKVLEQESLLLNIPRELRDEIYRHLVKGDYFIGGQPRVGGRTQRLLSVQGETAGKMIDDLNFNVFQVSKMISHEAMAVLYSESTFRFEYEHNREAIRLPPPSVLDRMMKLELNVTVGFGKGFETLPSDFLRHILRAWKATLNCITQTYTVRDTLRIRFKFFPACDIDTALPKWIYQELKALSRFRMVVLEFRSRPQVRGINCVICQETETSEEALKSLESKAEELEDYLLFALGPAITGRLHYPGHRRHAITLTFKPQENMPFILRGRAKRYRIKADMLDMEADTVEAALRAK